MSSEKKCDNRPKNLLPFVWKKAFPKKIFVLKKNFLKKTFLSAKNGFSSSSPHWFKINQRLTSILRNSLLQINFAIFPIVKIQEFFIFHYKILPKHSLAVTNRPTPRPSSFPLRPPRHKRPKDQRDAKRKRIKGKIFSFFCQMGKWGARF